VIDSKRNCKRGVKHLYGLRTYWRNSLFLITSLPLLGEHLTADTLAQEEQAGRPEGWNNFFFHFVPLTVGSERRWLGFMPHYNLFLFFSSTCPSSGAAQEGYVAVSPEEQARFNRVSCKDARNREALAAAWKQLSGVVWGGKTIWHISISASSVAEISLWDKMLKEERKNLHQCRAAPTNPVAPMQRAITECLGRFQLFQTSPGPDNHGFQGHWKHLC